MAIKWRKINRNIHRDVGYFFAAMTIIYALSGIALNHIDDWDPNYVIKNKTIQVDVPENPKESGKEWVMQILDKYGIEGKYKKHYFPDNSVKVFLEDGSLTVNLNTGEGSREIIKERIVFKEVNYLHYNHIKNLYTWFADIFAAGLILLAITGLFILRGKQGIKGRGAWLSSIGLLIPLIFLIIYYW